MAIVETTTTVSSSMKKSHIVMMPSPGMGHIIPFLELAKRLVNHHDFHVSFLVFTTAASHAQNQLFKSVAMFPHLNIIFLPPIEVPSSLTALVPRLVYMVDNTIIQSFKSSILDLEYPPDALVIDMFCFEAFGIAKELSLPTYLFFTSSAALLALLFYLPTFDESMDGVYADLPETLHVPGCHPLSVDDLIDDILVRDGIPTFIKFRECAGILVNTFDTLESVSLRAMRENQFFINLPAPPIFPIGPLIKSEVVLDDITTASGKTCLNWLNAQPSDSVLFVSFGSGGTLSAEQIFELAFGLEQSGHRFIWVVRNPTDSSSFGSFFDAGTKDRDDDPVAYLPKGFIERTREVGLVVSSWAPQMAILGHRATGGFLTHCGWNSILESIVCGVPMIAWPLFADQMMNARMICEELGIAVRPSREAVASRDEIERVVRMVMEGEEGKLARDKIKELQESAMKSGIELSDDSLCTVVHAWKMLR